MRGRPIVLFLLIFLSVPAVSGAQTDTTSVVRTVGRDGLTILHAAGYVFTGPARWEGSDWTKVAGLAAATGAAALLDDEWHGVVHRNSNNLNDRLADAAVQYGDAGGIIVFAGGFYAAGLFMHNSWLRETGLLAGTSILLSGAVSTITKTIVGRARPYTGLGNHRFKPFTLADESYLSFPSGHTVVAFSISTVLSRRIGNPWATVGLYALAAGTALSRTYTDRHWLSDVMSGGIISTMISNSVVSWYERGEDAPPGMGLNLEPRPGGIAIVYFF